MSQQFKSKLQSLQQNSQASTEVKVRNFHELLCSEILTQAALTSGINLEGLASLLSFALSENQGLVQSKALFNEFIVSALAWFKAASSGKPIGEEEDTKDNMDVDGTGQMEEEVNEQVLETAQEAMKGVWKKALAALGERSVSFEDQIATVREALADILEAQEEYVQTAECLKLIPLDSTTTTTSKISTGEYKAKIYIRIAQNYLEEYDDVSADAYINRAVMLVNPQEDTELNLKLLGCQARLLDFRRQFVPSALKYLEISYTQIIDEDTRDDALISAATCAILAGAGPQRSRLLQTLYKDPRFRNPSKVSLTSSGVYAVVEKMYHSSFVTTAQVEKFKEILKPHQLATLADGKTVLARAVMQHNLMAASRIYVNISMVQLGLILGLGAEEAEEMAGDMIAGGRLVGKIDQLEGILYFGSISSNASKSALKTSKTGAGGEAEGGEKESSSSAKRGVDHRSVDPTSLLKNGEWDERIGALCRQTDSIADMIIAERELFKIGAGGGKGKQALK